MRLKNTAVLAALALLPAALAGCGGGGGGHTSPFKGNYQGTFLATSPQGDQNGTLTANITDDGSLSGTSNNTTTGTAADLNGFISDNGQIQSSFKYPDFPLITANGAITRAANGHLVADLPEVVQNQTIGTVHIDLVKQ